MFPQIETEDSELNLAAISTLFQEARRVESNIRQFNTRNTSFWFLYPDIPQRQIFDYKKGFCRYNFEEDEWPFELSSFPDLLLRPNGKEICPVFYEELESRKGMPLRHTRSRAFAVYRDETIEVGTFEDRSDTRSFIFVDQNLSLYQLQGEGMKYSLRKI